LFVLILLACNENYVMCYQLISWLDRLDEIDVAIFPKIKVIFHLIFLP